MRIWCALVALLPGLLLAQERAAAPAASRPITVSLPRSINPQNGYIGLGFRHGNGLSLSTLQTHAGVYDYAIRADMSDLGPPTSLKLAIYIPGFRMVTPEFNGEDLQAGRTFIPEFVPLATTTIKGWMMDSAGRPLKDEYLRFDYSLTEVMGYYGYFDGMVPTIHVADTRTDNNGKFSVTVPSLLDDPFFRDTNTPGRLYFRNGMGYPSQDWTLDTSGFDALPTDEPLVIRKIRNGVLSGKLGREFLRLNSLPGPADLEVRIKLPDAGTTTISPSEMQARRSSVVVSYTGARTRFNSRVDADGTFELKVPPEKYDLEVGVPTEGRYVPIERDVVVNENGRRVFDLP